MLQCWYIPGIFLVCTRYLVGILLNPKLDTWWLVLRRRTGSHSTSAACDNISRPSHDSDFITPPAPTARILALGHVGVKGALRTENSMYIPFLTSTAYKAMLCNGRCHIQSDYDNGTEETVQADVNECWDLRSKNPSSYLCTQLCTCPLLVNIRSSSSHNTTYSAKIR